MKKTLAVFLLLMTLTMTSGCSVKFWAKEDNKDDSKVEKQTEKETETVDTKEQKEDDTNKSEDSETENKDQHEAIKTPDQPKSTGKIKAPGPEGVRPNNATPPSAAATELAKFSAVPKSEHRDPRS